MAQLFNVGGSASDYTRSRRQRNREQEAFQGFYGPIEEVVGAEVAAESGSDPVRAIFIGVATGVLTLLVNRWVERLLK